MNKMKKTIIAGSMILLYLVFFGLTFVFAEDRSAGAVLTAFTEYYEIYFLVLPAGAVILSLFDGSRNKEKEGWKLALGGMVSMAISFPLIYLVDHCRRVSLLDHLAAIYLVSLIGRLCLSLALTFGICKAVNKLIFDHAKLQEKLKKCGYGIGIFFVFAIKMYLNSDGNVNSWATVWYAMNYKDGVSSRLFVGELLSLLTGGKYISETVILAAIYMAYLVIILCLSIMMGKYLNHADQEEKKACFGLVALYMVMPGNIGFLWTAENTGRVETFVIAFLFLAIILAEKMKSYAAKYIVLSLGTVICMATYQAYLFLYFPILFAVMVCDVAKRGGRNPRNYIGICVNCIFTAAGFLYFQFCSSIHYDSVESIYNTLTQRTDMEISEMALDCEFFGSIKKSWYLFFEPMITTGNTEYLRERGFVNVILLLPILTLFVIAWRRIWVEARVNSWKSLIATPYFWITLCNLLVLVQFVLTMDWGRWFSAVLMVQFFELMYLDYTGDAGMKVFQKKFSSFIERHMCLCIFILIYLASLSPMEAAFQTEDSRRIVRNLSKVFLKFMN